ncbi:unnamed protein product [Dovyalis caffra]|uniref:Gustatory receptor n=1 Tax=Dovyalis caffra TaxID=77055 RepID=A0AAV1QRF4_9ROSI|nr:unnamed protein product [Dovyalis caffra]
MKHPTKTIIGINAINRRFWVRAMMEDVSKNGVLAVQTMRNNIMASTVLASTAIMLSSLIAVLMTSGTGDKSARYFVLGDRSELGLSIKFFSILVCFLVAFLLNVQSIRYYSHASILINVPFKKICLNHRHQHLTTEYVARSVNRGPVDELHKESVVLAGCLEPIGPEKLARSKQPWYGRHSENQWSLPTGESAKQEKTKAVMSSAVVRSQISKTQPALFGLRTLFSILVNPKGHKAALDYTLVPLGLVVMVAYHLWLLYRIMKHPTKTVIGINAINRRLWVRAMMEDVSKNGVLAVQTMRNNIMASTVLASTAIMLSSLIAVLMTSGTGDKSARNFVFGDRSELALSVKFFLILVCFLMAFLLTVQSIRYYSHGSILINVPFKKICLNHRHQHLSTEYVARSVNREEAAVSVFSVAFLRSKFGYET